MNLATQETLEAIFNTAIDGIIIIDVKGIMRQVNPAAARMFGYEASSEMIGKNVSMLMPADISLHHDQYIQRYVQGGQPKIVGIGREVDGCKKDGSHFPIRLAVSQVVVGEEIYFTGITHDLSDVKASRRALIELNQELESKVESRTEELSKAINKLLGFNVRMQNEVEERMRIEQSLREREERLKMALEREKELGELKSRFVSMASHEFRTPLAAIQSSAALLLKYSTSEQLFEKREKHLGKIKNAVTHLNSILNDFLTLSKVEEGKFTISLEVIDLRSFSLDTVEEMELTLKANQKICIEMPDGELLVESDRTALRTILYNLISNAIKYSPEQRNIYLRRAERFDALELEIRDEGIGIPDDDQKHLFDRFFRASNATNFQGTGLGLHIVKKYIDLLHGSIRFISKPGEGTSFYINFPKLNGKSKNISH